jgi:hypothetical protein
MFKKITTTRVLQLTEPFDGAIPTPYTGIDRNLNIVMSYL